MDGEDVMPGHISPTSQVTSALQKRISLYSSLSLEKGHASGETFRTLESELKEIETVLASHRRQRNALAPGISRLPPELLSHIFHYLTLFEPHYVKNPGDYRKAATGHLEAGLGWVKVTQVCHSWRQVAFADSQLWTTTTMILGEKWFDRMLELSRRQPSAMEIYVSAKASTGIFAQCPHIAPTAGLMDKVSRLQILGDLFDLSDLENLHAPSMEVLHMHLRYVGEDWDSSNTLFRRMDLRLKDLYVHGLAVDLNAPILRSLAHLSLTVEHDPDARVAFRDLGDFLTRLDALESLTIQGYMFNVLDDDVPSTSTMDILCPRLTYVNVYASEWTGILLLISRLRPSATARMTFATPYPQQGLAQWDHLLEHFKRRMLDHQTSPVCNMQTIEWRAHAPHSWRATPSCHGPSAPFYEKSLILSTWRDNCPRYLLRDYAGYDDPSPPLPDFQLVLKAPASAPRLDVLIPFNAFPAARSVSLRPVHRMNFEIAYIDGWQELFRAAQSLEWLRADRDVAERFLWSAHSQHFNVSGPAKVGAQSGFPKTLQTLSLLGVRWDHQFEEQSTGSMETMLNDLGRSYKRMKQPISEIIVGEASYEEDMLSCDWKGVKLSVVERPDWFTPDHEDWDWLAEF